MKLSMTTLLKLQQHTTMTNGAPHLMRPFGHVLATDLDRNAPLALLPQDIEQHWQVTGGTGVGKSVLLYRLAVDLFHSHRGGIIIDPHDSLYQQLLLYVSEHNELVHKIIFFDPYGPQLSHVLGYSPIPPDLADEDVSNIAASLVMATLKVNNQKPEELPRTTRMLFNAYLPIVQNRLSILETEIFLTPERVREREFLLRTVSDPFVKSDWFVYEQLPYAKKLEQTEAVLNRIRPLITNPRMRLCLGNTRHPLDFGEIMRTGKVVVCSLRAGTKAQREDTRLLGALLLNSVFQAAIARDANDPGLVPFLCLVDEAQNVLCDFISSFFNELRKFRTYFYLFHQNLAQFAERSPEVAAAIAANCHTKVCFALGYEDAVQMANEMLVPDIDLMTVKYMDATEKQRAYQSVFKVVSESRGTTESISLMQGNSENSGMSEQRSSPVQSGAEPDKEQRETTTDQHGSTTSRSETRSSGTTTTTSVTHSPVTLHETYFEEKPVYASLSELIHHCVAALMRQGKAECHIKRFGRKTVRARIAHTMTPVFDPTLHPELLALHFKNTLLCHSTLYQPIEEVQRMIQTRREDITTASTQAPTSNGNAPSLPSGSNADPELDQKPRPAKRSRFASRTSGGG